MTYPDSGSVANRTMERKDPNLKRFKGLIRLSAGDNYSISSSGLYKFPLQIVVPLPLKESANFDKVLNTPETLDLPVKTEEKILNKAVIGPRQSKTVESDLKKRKHRDDKSLIKAKKIKTRNPF